MKTIMTVAAFLMTTVVAHASTAVAGNNPSYYDKLGDLFAAGTKPSPAKLINTPWAGRCFFDVNPNDPMNGAYLFRRVESDVGPIATKSYEATAVFADSQAPDYFQTKEGYHLVKSVLSSDTYTFYSVVKTNNSLVITHPDGAVNELRLSDQYLVLEARSSADKAARIFARCYYFVPDYAKQ